MNLVFGDLIEIAAVKSRAGMRGDVDRAHLLAAFRVQGMQLFAGGEPDVLPVEGDAVYARRVVEGTVFANDFRLGPFHASILQSGSVCCR